MQGVANIQQPLVRFVDAVVWPVGQPGGRQRPEHDHVPEPAPGLLEIRLQQVRGVAVRLEPLVERGQQLRKPAAGVPAPGVQQRGAGRADQLGVAADRPQVQQADAGAELAAGDVGALGRGTYRVVEPDPAVPERIPDLLGQPVDRPASCRRAAAPDRCLTAVPAPGGPATPTAARAVPCAGPPTSAYRACRADSTQSLIKRRRSGPDVVSHGDRIATLRRSLVRSRFRARPARARRFVRERCRPPEPTRPCRHRCGRSERS